MTAFWNHFEIVGTTGRRETYFGGWRGLASHLADLRGDTILFEGGHCEEDAHTLYKVVDALYK